MFRLNATLKRGVASDLSEMGLCFPTLDEARRAARALARSDVVSGVMIVSDAVPPAFVEWVV